MHFLPWFFLLLSKIIHEVDHFHQVFFKLILRVAPVLFLTVAFSFLSCVSDNFTFNLLYSTVYTICMTLIVLLENGKNVINHCTCIFLTSKNNLLNCY